MSAGSLGARLRGRELQVALLTTAVLASFGARAQTVSYPRLDPLANGFHPRLDPLESGFRPRINAAEIYIDNVDLAAPGASRNDAFVTQVKPGFRLEEKRPRFQAFADYTFQYLLYSNSSARNQSYHQAAAFANGEVIPELFFLRADAAASQVVINSTRPTTLDSIVNATGNLANGYTGSISPYLQRHFGETVALLEYTKGFVKYRGTGNGGGSSLLNISDSRNERILASWGTDESLPTRFTWQASFDRERADYDLAAIPPFRYEQALLTLTYGVTPQLRLIGEGGSETSKATTRASGGLDGGFWRGGFSYQFSRNNEIKALAGHRFFGTTYEFLYRYTGRLLTVESTYTEGPTTAAQELFIRPLSGSANALPVVQPNITGGDLARLTGDVFVRKYLDNRLRLQGRRTAIELYLSIYRRNYQIDTTKNDRTSQGGASIVRDLNSRDKLTLTYGFRRNEIPFSGENARDSIYRLAWLHRITQTLSVDAAVGRLEGSGSFLHYDVNFAMIGVSKKF